jgi:hypothetical protein
MKKILIIGGSCVLAIVLLVFGAGLYINANIKEITQKHIGAGMQFEGIRFRYSPMPTIVVTGLTIDHGNNTVQIPSLELYPDLMALLKGDVSLRKVVAQEPLIHTGPVASSPPGGGGPASPPLTMAAIPAERVGGITINRGRVILKDGDALGHPVLFTVAVEDIQKSDQAISVQVKDFAIEELGIQFAGSIAISSFSPLKLMVQAPTASLNPAAAKDFLVRFGFLTPEVGNQIPRIANIGAKGLALNMDPDTGKFQFSSQALHFDQNELKDLTLDLAKGGRYELKCGQMLLDMSAIQGWLTENPKGKEVMDNLLLKAKLKALNAQGRVALSSIVLAGTQAEQADMTGSMDLKTEGLKVHLVSGTGEEQTFTINRLETRVMMDKGKPSLKVSSLQFSSSQGGTGFVSTSMSLPFHLQEWEFKTALDSLQIFDSRVNGTAAKSRGGPLTFDVALSGPSLAVQAKGHIKTPQSQKLDFEARLSDLRIAAGKTSQSGAAKEKPPVQEARDFDFSAIQGKELSGIAAVKAFQYGETPELRDVKLEVACQNNRAVVKGSIRFCQMDVQVDAIVVAPNQLVAQMQGKGANLDLTSFIACFSKELPVFMTGRITVFTNLFAKGENTDALLNSAEGDVVVTLNRFSVHKLSNLDSRLGFFLDMLAAAGLGAQKGDSIAFDRGVARANVRDGRVVLDRFSLNGPLMNTWGSGEFHLKEKRLQLTGQVQTALGITKDVDIDRILTKKET